MKVGGKQYRVEEGDSILVDRMSADEGDKVDLEPLLFADGDKSVLDGEGVKVAGRPSPVTRGARRSTG